MTHDEGIRAAHRILEAQAGGTIEPAIALRALLHVSVRSLGNVPDQARLLTATPRPGTPAALVLLEAAR